MEQTELPMHHEPCFEDIVIRRTKQCIDEGYFNDWDSSYQAMTEFLKFELENEREKNNAESWKSNKRVKRKFNESF